MAEEGIRVGGLDGGGERRAEGEGSGKEVERRVVGGEVGQSSARR